MITATDLLTRASRVMQDGDTSLEALFGNFAADCRFAWGNEVPVEGIAASQALVGRMLAGVSGVRHDVLEHLVGEDSVVVRMNVVYTLRDGGELQLPAATYMRFRDDRVCEYVIYQDPTPLPRR